MKISRGIIIIIISGSSSSSSTCNTRNCSSRSLGLSDLKPLPEEYRLHDCSSYHYVITRFLWTVSLSLRMRHMSCRTVFPFTGLWLGNTWPLLVMSSVMSTSAGWLWRTVVCTNVQQRTEWDAPRTLHLSGFTVMSLTPWWTLYKQQLIFTFILCYKRLRSSRR